MYAVIRTGGKQYRASEGDTLRVEKLPGDVGSSITFGEVLLLGGDSVTIGKPLISGASVTGTDRRAGPRQEDHRLQDAPP